MNVSPKKKPEQVVMELNQRDEALLEPADQTGLMANRLKPGTHRAQS